MSTPRILLIEDEPALPRGLSDALRTNGFDVVVATDGSRGLDAALEGQADLILLDIGLPKLNGIEAARQIRKLAPDSKILFVSREDSAEVVQEALSVGARGYIFKAYVGSELLFAVDAVIQGKQFISPG